jgi:ZIP family zinc transporter
MINIETLFYALILTSIAGLSTTIGSLTVFIFKEPSKQFISIIMGFSAGVMILISFVELLAAGIEASSFLVGHLFFFLGMVFMLLIDIGISHKYEFEDKERNPNPKLEKASLLVMIGIFIHNFPEGMATFVGTLKSVELGIVLAFAIALHNIPEGIAVAVPIYTSTKNSKKAFFWSFISGVSEPIGALIAGLVLFQFINDFVLGATLAVVGGFMVYISLDELLPASRYSGFEHLSIIGIILGMIVMAISLDLL